MRILVCGGRDFDDKDYLFQTLDGYELRNRHDAIISGAARGADALASLYANMRGVMLEEYPADWKTYGRAAGFVRNRQMLVCGKPDLVVAFPGGKGTAMMVKLAREAGVGVIEMGAKGSQTMAEPPSPKFKTNKFEKMYCDRMSELRGFSTPGQRMGLLRDMLIEEQQWIANMGSEYDEIMQADDLMNGMDRK